jgi:hypothetical protein
MQINDRCVIRTQDRHRVVVVSGVALAQYTVGDRMAEAHAMISLVEQGWTDQTITTLAGAGKADRFGSALSAGAEGAIAGPR